MELLKIDGKGKAYFARGNAMVPISQIEKEDILQLVKDIAISAEASMDLCDSEHLIKSPIEETIYVNLYNALQDLKENRALYLRDIDEKFNALENEMKLRAPSQY